MQIASRETPLHHTQALFQLFIFPPSWPLISKDIEGTWIPHDPLSPQSPVLRKDATDTSHPCSVTELSPHCRHLVSQNWVFFFKKKKAVKFPLYHSTGNKIFSSHPKPQNCKGRNRKLEATSLPWSAGPGLWPLPSWAFPAAPSSQSAHLPLPPSHHSELLKCHLAFWRM